MHRLALIFLLLLLIPISISQTTPEDYECASDDACPAGWTQVSRIFGVWCVRIYQGVFTQAEAEAYCNLQNATVSGAESVAERETIANLGKEFMESATEWTYGSLRVGFYRCDFTKKWILSDRYTIGINAFGWGTGEPKKTFTPTFGNMNMPNNCAAMWLEGDDCEERNSTRTHGTFYNLACSIPEMDGFRGFVCGKPAI